MGLALTGLLAATPVAAQGFSSARVLKARAVASVEAIQPGTSFQIAVVATVDPEWHINAHEPSFDYLIPTLVEMEPADGYEFRVPVYPAFVERSFTFTKGERLRVYEGEVLVGVDVAAGSQLEPGPVTISGVFSAQACNDTSCLAPGRISVELPIRVAEPGEEIRLVNQEIFSKIRFVGGPPDGVSAGGGGGDGPGSEGAMGGEIADALSEHGLAVTLGIIFLSGLALNLTPCVYPLIPITISYFGGQSGGSLRSARTFGLASVYVLGMSVTYSAMGVVAATTGGLLGSALQNPIVLGFVAAVMVALALSMFGLYEFGLPSFITNRITGRQGFGGALFMGLTVGLVAAPCIGPFVLGLLAYVGQIGDPVIGFAFFFVLSLGLGLPFLVLGTFSGAAAALPRAGEWMVWIRNLFGCLLIGMALYFLNPLLPDTPFKIAMAIVFIASGIFLGFIEKSNVRTVAFRAARYATVIVAVAGAAWMLAPARSGEGAIKFIDYDPALLEQAGAQGRPVIIDFTAEWCIACKELEHYTFADADVAAEAERFLAMRADMTSFASPPMQAIKQRFGILGLPWVVIIDGEGNERTDLRVTGYVPAADFLERLRTVDR
jgi:thiol:disulfide interchange protein DsbD